MFESYCKFRNGIYFEDLNYIIDGEIDLIG